MTENISNTKKYKLDSWIDTTEINDPNFLGRKRTDYSTFERGTTIPERYHKVFLDNLSKEISKGQSIKVRLILNNKEYKASVGWPASKDRKGVTIQILYNEKALKEEL